MNSTKMQTLKSMLLAGAALATVSSFGSGAVAQPTTGAAPVEKVTVTGSRIRSQNLKSNSPVTFVNRNELEFQGTVNVDTILLDLPQTAPSLNAGVNNGSDGSAQVDLRGLGAARTLVLVNGKRVTPDLTGNSADLNGLPVNMIKRVEVVTGGASAVYGSDAVAGVVNVILDDQFVGAELDMNYRETERADGETFDISGRVGANFDGGRGNVVVWGGHTERRGVSQARRGFSKNALGPNAAKTRLRILGSTAAPQGIITGFTTTTTSTLVEFNAAGNLVPFSTTFNFAPYNYLEVPQDRYNLGGSAVYSIDDHTRFKLLGRYSYNRVPSQLAPSPIIDSFEVNLDNPNLTPSTLATLQDLRNGNGIPDFLEDLDGDLVPDGDANLDGIDDDNRVGFFFLKRLVENGARREENVRGNYQINASFEGELSDSWSWELFAQAGRTQFSHNLLGDASKARFQQSILTTDGVTCIDPSGGCVVSNIFTSNPVNPAAVAFWTLDLAEVGDNTQIVAGGSMTGDFGADLTSPWAESPIAMAFGFEYREEEATNVPDDNLQKNNVLGFGPSGKVAGGFNVKEGFVEAKVPLIEGQFLFHNVSLEGGFRISQYSNAAQYVETYKYGGEWAPTEDIRFRALKQRATRAANIAELFTPVTESADTAVDPCSNDNPTFAALPVAVKNLCVATGTPVFNVPVASAPAGQLRSLVGGNPNLSSESSDTLTVGVVITPTFLKNFVLSVDYYDIDAQSAIQAGDAQTVLDQCYGTAANQNPTSDPLNVYCQLLTRSPAGNLFDGTFSSISLLNRNTGKLNAQGIDFQLDYKFDLADLGLGEAGSLTYSGIATYVDLFSFTADAAAVPDTHCEGLYGRKCGDPTFTYSATQRFTWNFEDLTLSLRWLWYNSAEFDSGATPTPTVAAKNYFDVSGQYDLTDWAQLNFGVINVADQEPPIFGNDAGSSSVVSGNTMPSTYDALGRRYFIGTRFRF